MSAPPGIFEALRASLADFRDKVEHTPGQRIAAVGHRDGTIPGLVRQVLSAIADALAWLASALRSVADVLRVADSVVALIELASDLLGGFASGLSFGDLPGALGLDPAPFKAVGDAIATGNAALSKGVQAVHVLPRPEDLAAIRRELELLLGKRANPALPGPGSLGTLLSTITITSS
ncbi:MAG TPA: hypothetical protein VND93_22175 [Myxococcales bacterium]|nr:hypothetical protein [Myxococcales bacterium]